MVHYLSQSNTAVHFVVQIYLKVNDRIRLHSLTNLLLCDLIIKVEMKSNLHAAPLLIV